MRCAGTVGVTEATATGKLQARYAKPGAATVEENGRRTKERDRLEGESGGVCSPGFEQPQTNLIREQAETVADGFGQGDSQGLAGRCALQHPTSQTYSTAGTKSVNSFCLF